MGEDIAVPEREISVNIKKANNGFVVSTYGRKKDQTYIYAKISEALEELESLFSVAEQKD